MPYKDPKKKREYDNEWQRKRRADPEYREWMNRRGRELYAQKSGMWHIRKNLMKRRSEFRKREEERNG